MALIKCPECKKEISDKSSKCINCGYPLVEKNSDVSVVRDNKKTIINILLIVVPIFLILLCLTIIPVIQKSDENIPSSVSSAAIEESSYDQLPNNGKLFLDAFFKGINTFYNPKSVIVKYIYGFDTDGNHLVDAWNITVSAQNQMGGYSEDDYTLYSDGSLTKSFLPHVDMGCNYDLDLINKAIQEHFE